MNIQDKVVLITGGAHRLGKAISIGLARAGAKVIVHYNHSEQEAQATRDEILALNREVLLAQGDFSNIHDIENVVDLCLEHFDAIDVLVNNAAVYFGTPLRETTQQQWDKLFEVDLRAPYFCSKCVAEKMLQRKSGKIINITDIAGVAAWAGFIPYSATKAGLIAITKGLAQELAPHIQVNAVAPGTVLLRENETANADRTTLLKKVGSPQDVVNTILFLIEGGDYITGEVITVDGGRLLA